MLGCGAVEEGAMLNFVLALLAITGAVLDRGYKKAGGRRPTSTEKQCFYLAIALCVALIVVLGVLGASAAQLGALTGFLVWPIFALWELQRLRVRRAYPIGGRLKVGNK